MKFLVSEPGPILELLESRLKLSSKTKARNLIKEGRVSIDGVSIERANHIAQAGQSVQIEKPDKAKKLPKAPFEILFEDQFIIVVIKPPGVLSVNRDNENSLTFHKMINNYVREVSRNKERVFLVHRLDREVSGVMVFAKSLKVQALLEERWKENDKCYYAIVEGVPKENKGTIQSWLRENAALKVYSTSLSKEAKLAVTHFKVIKSQKGLSLIEVKLDTGRKHQIRVHLSDMGCPIVGDQKYGAKSVMGARIALHAHTLALFHPITGERKSFSAPMPKELDDLLKYGT